MLAARTQVLLDAAGPDRIRQAEAAGTAPAGRAPRADESATVPRHPAAVLHLLWVGGPQLGINPKTGPDELADTVLAAARRADVPVTAASNRGAESTDRGTAHGMNS